MEVWRRCRIIGMVDKVSDEESGGKVWWQICGTKGIDMAAKEMRDGNIRYVEQHRWSYGLEKRQRTGQILTGNNYRPEDVLFLQ